MTERKMNRDTIKYIAMATMLLNHISMVFMKPGTLLAEIFLDAGYFTAPVMCYFLVEGYGYTRSVKKYGERLLLFALISQIPFCLAFTSEGILDFVGMNMLFTLFLCFLIIKAMKEMTDPVIRTLCIAGLVFVSMFSDWAILAPVFTILFVRAGNSEDAKKKAFITGTLIFGGFSIYHQGSEEFEFKEGAAMTNLLLADEINRTSPKTQSALLEAMEEGQITVDGITRDLPDPYIVIATQNPFGSIGTHSLPESQLDRFMIRTSLGYPDMESEIKMLAQGSVDMTTSGIKEQISVEELRKAREEAARLFVHEDILRYIVEIANETRRSRDLELGISPRGTIALLSMAKANAYLEGRDYVIPQDVKDVFFETIEHRVIRSKEAKVQRKTKEEILKAILYKIPLPKGNQKG